MAIINKITVPVTLVNGRATITYPLTRPKPTMVSTVNATVSAPMNLNNSINVPIAGYVPPPPEKFTITSNYVSGASSVTFTVKSDKLGSDTTVEYRLFEGTTVGASNHKRSGTLKLANGTGLINYSILSPKPTGGASNVICLVESPSVVQSTVSIPKYTPPYVPPVIPFEPTATFNISTTTITTPSGSRSGTFTYNGDRNNRSDTTRQTFNISAIYQYEPNLNRMGSISYSPSSVNLAPGQSASVTLNWSSTLTGKTGTISSFAMIPNSAYVDDSGGSIPFRT